MSDTSSTPSGNRFVGFLTNKLGPLPTWAWGLVIVGLAFVYYWWRNRNTATNATVTSTEDPTSYLTGTTSGSGTSGVGNSAVGNGGATEVVPLDNQGWAVSASNQLAAQGKYTAIAVNNALYKYLYGLPTSDSEKEIINAALTQFGSPPEGVQATVDPEAPEADPNNVNGSGHSQQWWDDQLEAWKAATAPDPNNVNGSGHSQQWWDDQATAWLAATGQAPVATPTATTPAKSRVTYMTHKGDTLNSISQLYYGKNAPDHIYADNIAVLSKYMTGGQGTVKLPAGLALTIEIVNK